MKPRYKTYHYTKKQQAELIRKSKLPGNKVQFSFGEQTKMSWRDYDETEIDFNVAGKFFNIYRIVKKK